MYFLTYLAFHPINNDELIELLCFQLSLYSLLTFNVFMYFFHFILKCQVFLTESYFLITFFQFFNIYSFISGNLAVSKVTFTLTFSLFCLILSTFHVFLNFVYTISAFLFPYFNKCLHPFIFHHFLLFFNIFCLLSHETWHIY